MKKSILFLLILCLNFSACDKGFEELNENPSKPTDVRFEAIFNDLVRSLQLGWNRQLFIHNEILYDATELAVVTAKTFGNVDSGTGEIWSNYYTALANARKLESKFAEFAIEDPQVADVAKAQLDILMAYKTFQMLDFFGDIPYSEAGKAFTEEAILRPAYDDDKEIYLSLLEDLKQASATILNSTGFTELGNSYLGYGDDALFNGNLGLWAKFSNSMQLKYLVRIFDKEPDLVNTEVANILTSGYDLINPGEDVVMSPRMQDWQNLGVNWSFREHNKVRLGTNIWNFLTDNDEEIIDPRAGIFFETNNEDEWVAFPQIADADTPQSGGAPYSQGNRDGDYFRKGDGNIYGSVNFYLIRDPYDIPEILMSAAEVKLVLSEIFLRGIGTTPDVFLASARYTEGMLASLDYWSNIVDNSEIWVNTPNFSGDNFSVTQHPKFVFDINDTEENNLARIYIQRWVSYFRQPWEAFSLMRQTDLLPREKDANELFRFKYPTSEISFNSENWNAQVTKMGGDETNVKLWWME